MATKKTANKKQKKAGIRRATKTKTAAKKPIAAKRKAVAKTRAGAKKKQAVAKKKKASVPSAKLKSATKKATSAKKARPAKTAKKKSAAAAKTSGMRRRDGAGHIDPKYAATLRAKGGRASNEADDTAFLGRKGRSNDTLAEELGEEWVQTATSGEAEAENTFNQSVPEDTGGPFVVTSDNEELAQGIDASNPKDATREPFPTT